jgi:hypothetical protein
MSRRIRRIVLAAAVGMFAANAASAQQPQPLPGGPGAPAAPAVAGPAPTFVQAPGAPAFVHGGCCSAAAPAHDCCCDSRGKHARRDRHCHDGGRWGGLTIGAGCANSVGCASWASNRTFAFGGCHQFFNPGNKCGHGGGLFGRAHCATAPLGTGIVPCGPCVYGSYLNR